jgi:hypothetical protein
MKNPYLACTFFLSLIFTSHLLAQHQDCHLSLEICDNVPFHINPGSGSGQTDPDVILTCFDEEYHPVWVKWTVMDSGLLTFLIIPDSVDQDIDFIVFKTAGNYDCQDKTAIRCMAAGANIGQPPHQWVNCTGVTGLVVGETDVEEQGGCPGSSNSYLAPIQAAAGDQYIMLINSFAPAHFGYTLSFTGSAIPGCITSSTYPARDNSTATIDLFPTVSTGLINIKIPPVESTGHRLCIYNVAGQVVYINEHVTGPDIQVDLQDLPGGTYIAMLQSTNTIKTQKFFITNQ